jgi:menaquinone-dependent protoporphyrinogen oxidase
MASVTQKKVRKKILIAYATTHGHTGKVAQAIASALAGAGADATILEISEDAAEIEIGDFDGIIIAASLHAGGYQAAIRDWVLRRARTLNNLPTAFVSVCLGVLQDDPKVKKELADVRERFLRQTGWTPQTVLPVAGALSYSRYNFVTRLMMRRIAAQAGGDTDTARDHEYTDWKALAAFAKAFARDIEPGQDAPTPVRQRRARKAATSP